MKETQRLTFSITLTRSRSKSGEKDNTNIPRRSLTHHEKEKFTPNTTERLYVKNENMKKAIIPKKKKQSFLQFYRY